MSKFAVILPAAGKSSRFGQREKKPFIALDGRAVWLRAAEVFVNRPDVVQTLIVIAPEDREMFTRRYAANLAFMDIQLVEGGAERFESVANALAKVREDAEFVAIHDAVRPGISSVLVDAVFHRAAHTGAALLALPVADTIKRADAQQCVAATISRESLWLAQTPQVFRRDWLMEAYRRRHEFTDPITDDAQLVEALGHPVHLVPGSLTNLKITTHADFVAVQALLKAQAASDKGPRFAHPFGDEAQW